MTLELQTDTGPQDAAAAAAAAHRFAEAWDEFVLAVRRAQSRGQQTPDELSLAQYYLLAPLASARAVPISQLADAAGVSGPTATRLVDGLQRAGQVRRASSSSDRRTVLVSITAAGRKRFNRRARQLEARRRRLYEGLEPGEREQSERLLRHLAQLLDGL